MHEDPLNLPPPDAELEHALAHLLPAAPPDTRRDTIAFAAGRRSARRSLTLWRTTSATLAAALSLTLFLPHLHTPSAPTSPPLASAPPAIAPVLPTENWQLTTQHSELSTQNSSPPAYLTLRDTLLTHGPDALPPSSLTSSHPAPVPRARTLEPVASPVPSSLFGARS
jgi:hypothetical protein